MGKWGFAGLQDKGLFTKSQEGVCGLNVFEIFRIELDPKPFLFRTISIDAGHRHFRVRYAGRA